MSNVAMQQSDNLATSIEHLDKEQQGLAEICGQLSDKLSPILRQPLPVPETVTEDPGGSDLKVKIENLIIKTSSCVKDLSMLLVRVDL